MRKTYIAERQFVLLAGRLLLVPAVDLRNEERRIARAIAG